MSDKPEDVEQLLQIAMLKFKDPYSENQDLNEVQRFCLDKQLKKGTHKIRVPVIYDLYKQWKAGSKLKPKNLFFKEFAKYFDVFRDTKYTYYMMDPEAFGPIPIFQNEVKDDDKENQT